MRFKSLELKVKRKVPVPKGSTGLGLNCQVDRALKRQTVSELGSGLAGATVSVSKGFSL